MKKLILFFAFLSVMAMNSAVAQTIIAQGYCGGEGDGTNLTWVLTSDSVLTISGSGEMENFIFDFEITDFGVNFHYSVPWFSYCSQIKIVILENNVTNIGNLAFIFCSNLTAVTIPNSVTSIGENAFSDCSSLNSVTIPQSITSIGAGAFSDCVNLISITIGDNVTTIGDYAFSNCGNLTSITIGDNVTTIGDYAFQKCGNLTSIIIGDNVTTIGDYAFKECNNLVSITIPNNVTTIGYNVFFECYSLTTINVGSENNNYASDRGVLFDKNITHLICYPIKKTGNNYTIPNSVSIVGDCAFGFCDYLLSVIIPSSVTSINQYAFFWSSLTSVIIGDNVTTIENSAFAYCYGLSSITIGSSVATIENGTFYFCNDLSSITVRAIIPPVVGETTFSYMPTNIPVYVPCGSIPVYRATAGWNSFTNYYEIRDTTFIFDTICSGMTYSDNGFSIPAVSGVYYHSTASVNGCDSVISLTLTVLTPTISGKITDKNQTPLSAGTVSLYLVQSGEKYVLKDTVSIESNGSYLFTSIEVGEYIIKVVAANSENTLPTYYGNTELWNEASKIRIEDCQPVQDVDITVIPRPVIEGQGIVKGYVSDEIEEGRVISQTKGSQPVQGVTVYLQLYQNGVWVIVAQTSTDADGYYEFRNLPAGEYRVILDIPGLEMNDIQTVTVNDGEEVDGINYTITANGIDITNPLSIAESGATTKTISVYPNPTNGQLTLLMNNEQLLMNNDVRLYDVMGRMQRVESRNAGDVITLDISHLPAGVYMLKAAGETVKVVKE